MIDAFSDASIEHRYDSTNTVNKYPCAFEPNQLIDGLQDKSPVTVSGNTCVVDQVKYNDEGHERCNSSGDNVNVSNNKINVSPNINVSSNNIAELKPQLRPDMMK